MLSMHKVSKQYGECTVLNGINLKMSAGSIVGLAGPSGSGKSTLLRCLQKLEPISAGAISGNATTGFMFQDFQLFPHMNVMDNLVYAPRKVLTNQDIAQRAEQLLQTLGLAEKMNAFPSQLSGGQKQRVALARCLMMQPQCLLCDEPTSGLDVATIEDVIQLLKSVHAMGVTMIIASHDLDFLSKIVTRIIVLKKGTIVSDMDMNNQTDPIPLLKTFYQEQ